MSRKLWEFCDIVIAAETREEALKEIRDWSEEAPEDILTGWLAKEDRSYAEGLRVEDFVQVLMPQHQLTLNWYEVDGAFETIFDSAWTGTVVSLTGSPESPDFPIGELDFALSMAVRDWSRKIICSGIVTDREGCRRRPT